MRAIFLILLMAGTLNSYAQKLPDVQQASLRAPANIKIDGKATEWGNKFQAYNTAGSLFYTISNDNKNLYVVINTEDDITLYKITNKGIKLSFNTLGKNDKNAFTIIYPVFDKKNKPYINFNNKPRADKNDPGSVKSADSVMRNANKRVNDRSKFIQVGGIPGIDQQLSIDNDKGITVAQAFDNGLNYTYELSIPLSLIGLNIDNPIKLYYNIIIEGVVYGDNERTVEITKDWATIRPTAEVEASWPNTESARLASRATTDLSGEYTLAK